LGPWGNKINIKNIPKDKFIWRIFIKIYIILASNNIIIWGNIEFTPPKLVCPTILRILIF